MKKFLLPILSVVFLAQYGVCADTTMYTTVDLVKGIKNAVVTDVSDSVTSGINNAKLAVYKTQLEQKEEELEKVEESSSNALVKCYKKVKIKRKIAELEADIEALEN